MFSLLCAAVSVCYVISWLFLAFWTMGCVESGLDVCVEFFGLASMYCNTAFYNVFSCTLRFVSTMYCSTFFFSSFPCFSLPP